MAARTCSQPPSGRPRPEWRYRVARRLTQAAILLLLAGGATRGWTVLAGDFSLSRVLGAVPLADPFAALQMLAAGTRLSRDVLIGAGLVLLLYALVAGRAFCAWVCPVNAVTDLAGWLQARLPGNDGDSGAPLGRPLVGRQVRFWALGLSLVLSALLGAAAFEMVSPIGLLQRGLIYGMGLGWTAAAAIFLFDLFGQRNGFCGSLCPLGAFYALVTPCSLLRVHHDHRVCTRCMDCKLVCPEPQVLGAIGRQSGAIRGGACTNCGRCIEVCPDGALCFGFGRLQVTRSQETGGIR